MQRRTRWGGRQAFILEMAGSIPARCTNTWDQGLLGDGRRPLKAEKRVRNPLVLPKFFGEASLSLFTFI